MKSIISFICLTLLVSCNESNNFIGEWYSPNGLIELTIKNDYYEFRTLNGTENGKYSVEGNSIILDDSTLIEFKSDKLELLGHEFTRLKPKTKINTNINLSGNKFYWTFELDGLQTDTLIFSDSTYFSTFNEKTYRYQLVNWSDLVFFTDNNLSNIGDKYSLIQEYTNNRLLLDTYSIHSKSHQITELIIL